MWSMSLIHISLILFKVFLYLKGLKYEISLKGQIFIESLNFGDPLVNKYPILDWQTYNFALSTNSLLNISGIIFNGSSVHANRSQCVNQSSCCDIKSYSNASSTCYLKGKRFPSFWANQTIEGFFNLKGPNCIFLLTNVTFVNFYGVKNYHSLIWDKFNNSQIAITDLIMNNVYFLKGIFFCENSDIHFGMIATNIQVSKWNFYSVNLQFNDYDYDLLTYATLFTFERAHKSQIVITNLIFIDSTIDFIFGVFESWLSVNNVTFRNAIGAFQYVYGKADVTVSNFNSYNISSSIEGFALFDNRDGSNVIIQNAVFDTIIFCLFGVDNANLYFENGTASNLLLVKYGYFSPTLLVTSDYYDVHIVNLTVQNLRKFLFMLVNQIGNGRVKFSNSCFQDIDLYFQNNVPILFSYTNMYFENCIFTRMTEVFGIFLNNADASMNITLNLKSSVIYNMTSTRMGPLLITLSVIVYVTFEDCLIDSLYSGYMMTPNTPDNSSNYLFKNTHIANLRFDLGFFLPLFNDQSAYFEGCVFSNITFLSSSSFSGIFMLFNATVQMVSCSLVDIHFPSGSGNIILGYNGTITLRNTTVTRFNSAGSGGIQIEEGTNAAFYDSSFIYFDNQDAGIVQAITIGSLLIVNCSFLNNKSYKDALFFIKDPSNVVVMNSTFANNVALYENAGISIRSRDGDVYFYNNEFRNNTCFLSLGAGLTFINCFANLYLLKNSFVSNSAESGTNIYVSNVNILLIQDCKFINSTSISGGTSISLLNGTELQINNTVFYNNSLFNGEGENIYIEDCSLAISNSIFYRDSIFVKQSLYSKGSAISLIIKNNLNPYNVFFGSCNFSYLIQDLEVISIIMQSLTNSSVVFNNLSFDNIQGLSGNGLLTCMQCAGLFQGILVQNVSINNGDMFEIFSASSDNITIFNIKAYNNIIVGKGNFFDLADNTGYSYLTFVNFSLTNNSIVQSLLVISQFNSSLLLSISATSTQINLFFCEITGITGQKAEVQDIYLQSSTGSLFQVNNIGTFALYNILVDSHTIGQVTYCFLCLLSVDTANFENSLIRNSIAGPIEIQIIVFSLVSVTFQNLSYDVNNPKPFFQLSNIDIEPRCSIFLQNLQIIKINYGFSFHNIQRITVSNLAFIGNPTECGTTSFFKDSDPSALVFSDVNEFLIQDTNITTYCSRVIDIYDSRLTIQSKGEVTGSLIQSLSTLQIKGEGIRSNGKVTLQTSAVNFDFLKNPSNAISFEDNKGTSQDETESSLFLSETTQFSDGANISLYVLKPSFYSTFQDSHKGLIAREGLIISSQVSKIGLFINKERIKSDGVYDYYSGNILSIEIVAYDSFDVPSTNLNRLRVGMRPEQDEYSNPNLLTIRNNKSMFDGATAEMDQFVMMSSNAIVFPVTFLTYVYRNSETESPYQIYYLKFRFNFTACSLGFIFDPSQNNKCIKCQENTYSLEINPTNNTFCKACPSNTNCINGSILIPNPGYWNYYRNNEQILRCETPSACLIVYQNGSTISNCTLGYLGNVCHECDVKYGKTLNKTCESCSSQYKKNHVGLTILRWVILALMTIYQYYLIFHIDNAKCKFMLGILNVYMLHTALFSMVMKFQTDSIVKLHSLSEFNRVFSFFENNLFLTYCMAEKVRGSAIYYLQFFYFLFNPIIQFLFSCIFVGIWKLYLYLRKTKSMGLSELKRHANSLFCLFFVNNFITLSYYFIGMVFYFELSPTISVSVHFMELSYGSLEFFGVFFTVIVGIFPVYIFLSTKFFRRFKLISKEVALDTEYINKNEKKILFFSFLSLFSFMALSHYTYVGRNFSLFSKHILAIYIGMLASFKFFENGKIQILKVSSFGILIISFSDMYNLIIVLNSLFFVFMVLNTCFVAVGKKVLLDILRSKKRQR